MSEFLMPSLGADMQSGKLVEWVVKPGSRVRKGDVIAVVETHKGAFEIDIFEDGEISELCAAAGDIVPVGGLLARFKRPNEAPTAAPTPQPARAPAPVAAKAPEPAFAMPPVPEVARMAPQPAAPLAPAAGQRAKVTPAARRRAAELGIEPEQLEGTGIDGSVTLADVEAAPPPVKPAVSPPPAKPRRGFDPEQMREGIAAAMSLSKREIPHYYLSTTIDMGPALAWLGKFNGQLPPERRLLPAVLLLKATALALGEVPQLNGFWVDGHFRPSGGVHIGWAIALRGGGLIAPAIHDVDRMKLPELMEALRDLVGRARAGGLRSSEMTDPSFTVTSLGDRGVDSVTPVIYPPQVAIAGFGRIAERPWVVDGQVTVRPLLVASLGADHRASDGHIGGLFIAAIERLLLEPDRL
jgi:pyruvate dehydrogenase E2 component (dihydrolipoamide acetyltransferase)